MFRIDLQAPIPNLTTFSFASDIHSNSDLLSLTPKINSNLNQLLFVDPTQTGIQSSSPTDLNFRFKHRLASDSSAPFPSAHGFLLQLPGFLSNSLKIHLSPLFWLFSFSNQWNSHYFNVCLVLSERNTSGFFGVYLVYSKETYRSKVCPVIREKDLD